MAIPWPQIIPSPSRIVAGRPDGFGMRFCNFLYHAELARRTGKELILVWPSKSYSPAVRRFAFDELFKTYPKVNVTYLTDSRRALLVRKQSVSEETLLQNLPVLRNEYRFLEEHDSIKDAFMSMPSYDYGIHARLGDVERIPFIEGKVHGRYFPLSGYRRIVHKLLAANPRCRIFIASNSRELLTLKNEYPSNIDTEHELLMKLRQYEHSSLRANWLIIRQLSKVAHLISPVTSSFSLLARVTSASPLKHSTPSGFLGVDDLISELHQVYRKAASLSFRSPRLSSSSSLDTALAGKWQRVPLLLRLEVCLKILFS